VGLRVAQQGTGVAFLSGEMDEERLMERALAIEGRVAVDELRTAKMNDLTRAGIGAAAVRLRGLPLSLLPPAADDFATMPAQLPHFDAKRPDPRPTLDDFGHLGAVKQHADVVLAIFREEMYNPGGGVEGATELLVAKNRNGPTGFVDLYFYRRWMRIEDMLDP